MTIMAEIACAITHLKSVIISKPDFLVLQVNLTNWIFQVLIDDLVWGSMCNNLRGLIIIFQHFCSFGADLQLKHKHQKKARLNGYHFLYQSDGP